MYSSLTFILINSIYIHSANSNLIVSEVEFKDVYSSYQYLTRRLLENYPTCEFLNTTFPPPKGSDAKIYTFGNVSFAEVLINVSVRLKVERIVEMDVQQQSLALVMDELITWKDNSLSWELNDEQLVLPINVLHININHIWIPDIYPDNVVYTEKINNPYIDVDHEGMVYYKIRSQHTLPCAVNVNMFPYDVHECTYTLSQRMKSPSR